MDDVDLAPLRNYWHPVAYSHEVGKDPIPVTVLDEPVVVVRASDGVRAFRDLCPHRGARLSMGSYRHGRLVCPYHGFEYDAEGRCRLIPAQPPDRQNIPSQLRLERYRAAERCGIVWTAMDEPRQPLPELAELDGPEFDVHQLAPETWETSAARWMDNFLDITHFPHVHAGILGDPSEPLCQPYEVHETPTGLWYEVEMLAQLDPLRWPSEANNYAIDVQRVSMRTELFFPFTVSFTVVDDDGTSVVMCTGLPVSGARVKFFNVQAVNGSHKEMTAEVLRHVSRTISEQDRLIAEHQRPEMLPVDLTQEVHLRVGDAISVAYRRRLEEAGLTYA